MMDLHSHVLVAAIQTRAGLPGPAPPTQRISGQNTLAAASVDGAPGHRYSRHALRCSHVQNALQNQNQNHAESWTLTPSHL